MGTAGEGRKPFFGYLVVAALVMTSFMPLSLALSCAGIFYTSVAAELGVGVGTMSYYTSIMWATSLFVLPALGRALDKLDARICVSAAICIIALTFVWLSRVSALWQFFGAAVVMGLSLTMLLFLAPSTLVNRWFAQRAGFFIGLIMAFTGVGGVVWSAVGGVLIQQIGWQATYLAFAGLSLLTLPFGIFCVASRPEDKGMLPYGFVPEQGAPSTAGSSPVEHGASCREAFRSPLFFLIVAACFTLNMGMYVYFVIPGFASTLEASAAMPLLGAFASSAAMAGQTLSKLVLGYVADSRPHLGAICAVLLGLLGLGMLAFTGFSALLFCAGAFAYGIFYGVTNVMMPAFTARAFGVREYPKIYARVSMAASVSAAVSGFLWGTIVDSFGFGLMFAGIGAFMAATVALFAAMRAVEKRLAAQTRDSERSARRMA